MTYELIENIDTSKVEAIINRMKESYADYIKACLESKHDKFISFIDPDLGYLTFDLEYVKPNCIRVKLSSDPKKEIKLSVLISAIIYV